MALYLQDLEALSEQCRGFGGGGLTAFLTDERVSGLSWPEDVVEQWLYWFAGSDTFQADYGNLDLTSIEWTDELVPAEAFLTMPTGPSDVDVLDDNAKLADHWSNVREHLGVPQYWEAHGTWFRRPLLIDRSLLYPDGDGLQVIEGRTRVGILRGFLGQGRAVASLHQAWVARAR
jgi:hypothetical protein